MHLVRLTIACFGIARNGFPRVSRRSIATAMADKDNCFQGKTVVITGAGGNFGKEGCLYFLRRGARVAALDNVAKTLEALKQEVKETMKQKEGEDVSKDFGTYECDVTNVKQVHEVVDRVVEHFDHIDMLWNNAGYQGAIVPTLEYDPEDFSKVMNINVMGMFNVLQAVAKKMADSKNGGTIVNTASVAGMDCTPAMVAYSASKAAILSLTVTAAKDLAPYNIRVNSISPALIGPGFMWDRQNELHAKSGSPYYAHNAEEVAKNKVNSVPLKRLGTMQEVIKGVAFLLGDESSYSTATNLVVDGGISGGLRA